MINSLKKENKMDFEDRITSHCFIGNKFIEDHPREWKLDYDVDLEVTNHVIRCKASDGTIDNYKNDVINLVECQNSDGGWGNTRDDTDSKVRSSALTIQMLLRSNRIIKDKVVLESISKGLEYLIVSQEEDGRWFDPTWHYLDAISVSVGTLLFAINEPQWSKKSYKDSLTKGIEYIKTQRDKQGLWFYKKSGSPVTITAHLLPKCVAFEGVQDIDKISAYSLIKLQSPEGHWDDLNTDHTCDSVRALMLTASRVDDPELYEAVYKSAYKAISWLLDVSEGIGGGLGDQPGMPAHVERTCDGIDTMIKFQQFYHEKNKLIRFWK